MRHFIGLLRWLPFAALFAATFDGCKAVDLRGKGYDDQTQALTSDLRPEADESRFTGLDARARDIERNLGVR